MYYDFLANLGLDHDWFGENGPWVLLWAVASSLTVLVTLISVSFGKIKKH
jgi:hypothetical protein